MKLLKGWKKIGEVLLVLVGIFYTVRGARQLYQGLSGSKTEPLLAKSEVEKAFQDSALRAMWNEEKTGLQFEYPQSWKITPVEGGTQFAIFDGVVNIRISVDDFSGQEADVTPQAYSELTRSQLSEFEKQGNIKYTTLSEQDTTVSGFPGHEWTYKVLVNGVTGSGAQIWLIKDKKVLIFNYMAAESIFDTFYPIFQSMVQSLRLAETE